MRKKTLNDFDSVAKIYDALSKFVFGKSMVDAQTFFLSEIPQHAKILILGGGTGWLLEELIKRNARCEVWYIEASLKMLELSKKRLNNSKQQIHYIHGTESSISAGISYDVVITNFFLDLFAEKSCEDIVKKIGSSIRPGSKWIITEFENNRWWHGALLKIMYTFFRNTSNIEASKLPEWQAIICQQNLVELKSVLFYGDFIKTAVYSLPEKKL
jgi:tRNA (cmo5U34)-methyltransferase